MTHLTGNQEPSYTTNRTNSLPSLSTTQETEPTTLMQTSDKLTPQNLILGLEGLYAFKDRQEVRQFLEQHPFLVSILGQAYAPIRKHFRNSEISLELVSEPD